MLLQDLHRNYQRIYSPVPTGHQILAIIDYIQISSFWPYLLATLMYQMYQNEGKLQNNAFNSV